MMERVTVNIRSPVSSISDVRLECELDWRVFRIKQKISELFPGNPSAQSQKLVYAGKLLEDSAMLRDILRMEDDCTMYTIHLVCRVAAKKHEEPDDRSTEGPLRTEEEEEVVVMPTGQDQVQDWMRYINGLTINNNDSSQLSEENLQQMAWMQQMYSQYLNQYMMYMHSGGVHFVQPGLGVDSVQGSVQVQTVQGGGEGQVGGGGGLPPVLNAGGGGGAAFQQEEEEGPGRNRDILDYFYISSRVLVLMSIVYFYSSLARFLMVGSLFLFLYALQMGLLQGQNREQQNNIQQEVENIREEGGGGGGGGREAEQDEDEEEEEPDLLSIVSTFVLTFFSSLIPDHNQAVV